MYQNAINTRKKIRNAMFALLKDGQNLQDISVTDLVKKADISRGSFYNHYKNVMEVAYEVEADIMDRLKQLLDNQSGKSDIKGIIKTIFAHLKENEQHFRAIIPAIPKYLLDDIKDKFLKNFLGNAFSRYNSTLKGIVTVMFLANGLSMTYLDYLEDKINVNLDQLCDIYTDIITNLLDGLKA